MKKIILFIITLFVSITLFGCNGNIDVNKKLQNSSTNYYVTSNSTQWIADDSNKMEAISLNDGRLSGIPIEQKNIKFLYIGQVTLDTSSNIEINHLGEKVNFGLTFEIVNTNTPNDIKSYKKLTSKGNLYESLSNDFLYSSDKNCKINGCVGKESGTYTVIFAEYLKVDTYSYGIALVPVSEKTPAIDELENVKFTDKSFEHDGTAKSIEVENLPNGYTVEYSNNNQTEVGTYVVKAQIKDSTGNVVKTLAARIVITASSDKPTPTPGPTEKYTITFDNKGHGTNPETLTEQLIIPSSLPTLTEEGYSFDGWYLDEECVTLVKPGDSLTQNIILYAKWTENEDIPSNNDTIYDGEDVLPSSSKLADSVQDGLILHAWNWSYKNIELNLENIARSGYTTVQVSPVQQPKDYKETYPKGWAEQWWKFYQPLSYSIATSSWLGSKSDLKSLCTAAEKYGIKIIADIVANHTANVSDEGTSNQSTPHKTVGDYETELYSKKSTYFRNYIANNDSSIQAVVQGSIGMPDLKTETEYVQNMIIDLLKECIDCGIDGFRFDAAKHIETPDDGQYASNFWPNVLNAATSYATGKNVKLYYYGEILNTCGNGRNFSSYTKYMSITDNVTGNEVRKAVVGKNSNGATATSYKTGQPANKLVLWAESHDTYANDEHESTNVSVSDINKTWALVASRKDATALYFARPGEVGSVGTYDWMSNEVSAINIFHNQFIGANESLYSNGNFSVIERYSDNDCGLVIVNCNGTSSSVSFNTKNIANGEYIDQISGNKFTVSNGTITGNIGTTGIAVITKETAKAPIATLSQEGGYFSNSLTLNIDLSFATSARIKYGNEEKIITNDSTISIGSNMKNGESIEVEVCVVNNEYRVTKTYKFIKLDGVTKNSVIVSNVPERYASGTTYDVYAWVWKSGGNGRLVKTKLNGTYIVFDINSGEDNFLLLTVGKGTSSVDSQTVWQYAVKKTNDFIISQNAIYEAPEEIWVNAKTTK